MAPKPGYGKFNIGEDEMMVLYSDAPEVDSAGVIKAEFWNIGGDRFDTDYCEMTLEDTDGDTYWDSFTIAEDALKPGECLTYDGRTGLIQYILQTKIYESFFFTEETTGSIWQLATYEQMYATTSNGGRFPWDPEAKPSNAR